MTTNASFDDRLAGWLLEDSAHRVPDHLDEVLMTTRAMRQRPWWSSPERWLPVDITARTGSMPDPRLGRLLLVGLLLLALAALVVVAIGSFRSKPAPPFGPARNGAIAFAASGDIYTVDGPNATPRLIVSGEAADTAPFFWRDGLQLGFLRDSRETGAGFALMVASSDGSNVRHLVDFREPPGAGDASPDGSVVAFAGGAGRGVYVVRTDATAAPEQIDAGPSNVQWMMWRPPDGNELLYLNSDAGRLQLYGVKSDGTERHLVKDLGFVDQSTIGQLDPSVSADGRYMVYASVDSGAFRNHLVDLETGVDRTLELGPPGGHELHGILSPHGGKVLFHYADGENSEIQEMLAPIDGSEPAIRVGPPFPIIEGSAELNQAFSPDGQTIMIYQGRERLVRFVDAEAGGIGRNSTWQPGDLPAWQRLAP